MGALLVLFSFTERPTRLTEPTTLEISASSANKTSGVASDDNQKEKTTTETQSLPELDKKSKTPLIILDGKKITNKEFEELPSNNIDNMSILKDQAAEGLYGKKGKNGVVVITSKRDIDTKTNETMASVQVIGYGSMPKGESTPATNKEPQTAQTAKKEVPFIMAEVMPKFEGGDLNTFRTWVMGQIKYPKEAKITKDLIFAEFLVQKDGSVGDIKILKKADDAFADEVVRVLKSSPKWTPGQQRGIPIPVQYTIPIVFNVQ